MVIKFLINILELVVIAKITWMVLKYFIRKLLFGNKSKRKGFSASSKIGYMISKEIHVRLNNMMKAQKERLMIEDSPNVTELKKYKSKKAN